MPQTPNMTDTQRLEKPADYFSQGWGSTSPNRIQGSVRSPGSSFGTEHMRTQIRPGANNSFNLNGSPIRGMRQPYKPASPARDSRHMQDRPQDGQAERVRSPKAHISEQMGPAYQSTEDRTRRRRAPSQKAMLSQALQKANHAVVLDNAQNFEGAVKAYYEACDLLEQVMQRSSGGDDRRKLEAIRNTYRNRIKELQSTELAVAKDKALPEVPISPYAKKREQFASLSPTGDGEMEMTVIETATPLYMERESESQMSASTQPILPSASSQRQPSSVKLTPLPSVQMDADKAAGPVASDDSATGLRHELDAETESSSSALKAPMDKEYMPPPLSPRPPASPQPQEEEEADSIIVLPSQEPQNKSGHQRLQTMESTSWLDTIEESGGSSNSSIHSRSSSVGLRRKHLRTESGDTEAEFDAALDAAVEAAYDDGYELVAEEDDDPTIIATDSYLDNLRKNVELAKERVRDAERETQIHDERDRQKKLELGLDPDEPPIDEFQAEEEERMLEEMTKNYILSQQDENGLAKSIAPRQSDSSGFSGRTLGTSVESTHTTGTSLSTVNENAAVTTVQHKPPVAPPPTGALPLLPPVTKTEGILPAARMAPGTSPRTSGYGIVSPGVRERRLSGQKAKELTINTAVKLPVSGPKTQPIMGMAPLLAPIKLSEPPKSATLATELAGEPEDTSLPPSNSLPESARLLSNPSPASAAIRSISEEQLPVPASPAKVRPTIVGLRKNFSSSSLKSLTRHGGGNSGAEDSPGTPMTRMFSAGSIPARNEAPPDLPDLPTPGAANFSKAAAGGISFIDHDIHSPPALGSPGASTSNPPIPLEPCPESFLLRPFWLMRAIYQTIAHPRGGYITTRLFVPRDTWRVINVKLKNVDEKVANCDLLTAALLNLSKVDTLDADAVLEEIQAFELILDQVQSQLNKKLGAEVGIQGSAALFRSPPLNSDEVALSDTTRTTNSSSKSYLSWKRLRSKTSTGPGLPMGPPNGSSSKGDSKDFLTMRSLPMTSNTNPRFAKRDPTKVLGIGPHSHYMASLGRLCDAVQILDQIARQVEDPGLRLSSQTHVGLELCIRHAAEFFAFFVCRFALSDIGMMLDKFVKRGSEWVLS